METSSLDPFAGGDPHEADNIPRVGYEVTCETESLSLASEMVNGHTKQKTSFLLDPQNAISVQPEPYPNHLMSESARVSLSTQLNSAHSAPSMESLLNLSNTTDVMQTAANKYSSVEPTSIGPQLSRKRSLSTSPHTAESLTVPSKLLSLVHASSALTTTRRPIQTQLMQSSPQSEVALVSPAIQVLPKTTEAVSSSHPAVQRVTPKSTHGPVGLHSTSANRPHSQLVLQMCRPVSETLSAVVRSLERLMFAVSVGCILLFYPSL